MGEGLAISAPSVPVRGWDNYSFLENIGGRNVGPRLRPLANVEPTFYR